jgi:hypothetical protein
MNCIKVKKEFATSTDILSAVANPMTERGISISEMNIAARPTGYVANIRDFVVSDITTLMCHYER